MRSLARSALVSSVLAWSVLVPAAAQAARPGTLIGMGEAPSIAVAANGTGYVVWNDQPPGQTDEPVGLCVIPRGAARCSSSHDIIVDGQSGEAQPPLISVAGNGRLAVAAGRCCSTGDVEITSTDGGATFSTPAAVGGLIYFDGAIGPSGQVLFVQANSLNGILSQYGAIGAPADNTATLINPSPGISAPAGFAGNIPVVVASGSETTAAIYSGSGDPNDGASWNNVRVPGSTFDPSVATGSRGLFLLQDTGEFQRRLTIRRLQGNRFGRAHVIVNTNETQGTALAEDAAGRLIAIWYSNGRLFAAASRSRGVHWTRPHVIATDVQLPGRMSAALASDGRGWLAYGNEFGTEIRLVRVSVDRLLGIKAAPPHKRHRKPRRHHKPPAQRKHLPQVARA